jgi:hypothetical protein
LTLRSKVITILKIQNKGVWQYTICKIIPKHWTTNRIGHIKNYRRPLPVGTLITSKKVLKTFKKDPPITVRAAATILKNNPSTSQKIKAKDLGINVRINKVGLNHSTDQEQRLKIGCRFVFKKHFEAKNPEFLSNLNCPQRTASKKCLDVLGSMQSQTSKSIKTNENFVGFPIAWKDISQNVVRTI